mgnify:CR=1 FL=1
MYASMEYHTLVLWNFSGLMAVFCLNATKKKGK